MSTKLKSLIYLWSGTLIYSASRPIIGKLGQIGVSHPIHNRNPISFCNVLFLSNFIAGLVFLVLGWRQLTPKNLKTINSKQWLTMIRSTIFISLLSPIFYFIALMLTEVINVVLISSTEVAWTLLLGYIFLKEKPSKLIVCAAILATLGSVLIFFLHQPELMPKSTQLDAANLGNGWLAHFILSLPKPGEFCAFLAAFFTAVADIFSRQATTTTPVPLFNIFRSFIGAIIFFVTALSVFGWGHFADLFSPFLWEWMLFYGVVIVAVAVYTWNEALKTASISDMSLATAFLPIGGIIFAYLIVNEIPDQAQIIGGLVILMGIIVGLFDNSEFRNRVFRLVGV